MINYLYNLEQMITCISEYLCQNTSNIVNYSDISACFKPDYSTIEYAKGDNYGDGLRTKPSSGYPRVESVFWSSSKPGKNGQDRRVAKSVSYIIDIDNNTAITDKTYITEYDLQNHIYDYISNRITNDIESIKMESLTTTLMQQVLKILLEYCHENFKYVVSIFSDKYYFVYEPIDLVPIDTNKRITLICNDCVTAAVTKDIIVQIFSNIKETSFFRHIKYIFSSKTLAN